VASVLSHSAYDIAQLAGMVGLSSSRLSHLFKRDTGRDLRSFLTERRLQAAAQMLLRDATSVKVVSYSVGYRHPASFVRAFRKRFGAAPKKFRAAFR
jgi:AraC-like DNA-binding protein